MTLLIPSTNLMFSGMLLANDPRRMMQVLFPEECYRRVDVLDSVIERLCRRRAELEELFGMSSLRDLQTLGG
jgi:hypothetical protein